VIEKGYGGFNLPVEIYFKSNNEETRKTRCVVLYHFLAPEYASENVMSSPETLLT
jgi:transcription initiation factor IIF auxiliary subunit